jgi:hypothetical protein
VVAVVDANAKATVPTVPTVPHMCIGVQLLSGQSTWSTVDIGAPVCGRECGWAVSPLAISTTRYR